MKKLTFSAIAVCISLFATAQVQFGAKAGLNLANLSGGSGSILPSIHVGGLVNVPLFSNFVLQPELMYSGQGAKFKGSNYSETDNLSYINVPVLFKYKDPSGFFAEAGPQFGFLVSAKEKYNGVTENIKSLLKSTDVSFSLGAGYLLPVNLGFDVRYNLGLTSVASGGTTKNNVIQIGVFYMFGESKGKK